MGLQAACLKGGCLHLDLRARRLVKRWRPPGMQPSPRPEPLCGRGFSKFRTSAAMPLHRARVACAPCTFVFVCVCGSLSHWVLQPGLIKLAAHFGPKTFALGVLC